MVLLIRLLLLLRLLGLLPLLLLLMQYSHYMPLPDFRNTNYTDNPNNTSIQLYLPSHTNTYTTYPNTSTSRKHYQYCIINTYLYIWMCGCIGYITIHFALLRGLDTTLQGFIMAEVMAFSDLKELGSEANVKAKRCRVDLSLANILAKWIPSHCQCWINSARMELQRISWQLPWWQVASTVSREMRIC